MSNVKLNLRSVIRAVTVAFALSLSIAPASGANAQQACGKRTDVVHSLGDKYKETTTAVGLVNNGMLIEILTSKTGSWTLLMTRTNGVACVMAAGEAWEAVKQGLNKEPAA